MTLQRRDAGADGVAAILGAVLLLAGSLAASAAEPWPDPLAIDIGGEGDPRCRQADDMVLCLSGLGEESRQKVLATFETVLRSLEADPYMSPDERAAAVETMRRTQAAWVASVDARCNEEIAIGFRGGTGRNFASMTCFLVHDKRRQAELDDLAL